MVVFDLACAAGHKFEGWFASLEDLEAQLAKGMVACPACGDKSVRRIPSGFALTRQRSAPDHEQAGRLLGQAMLRYLKENFEDVGPSFATEALKIHYGASQARNIRGVSTPAEEKMLKDEGVSFFKVGAAAKEPASSGGEEG